MGLRLKSWVLTTTSGNELPGVDATEPAKANGQDNEHIKANDDNAQPKLEVYVTRLKAELDEEIAAINSNPNDDKSSDDES